MKTVQVKESVMVGTFVRFDYDKKKKTAAVWQEERSLGVIAIAFEQESLFIGKEMLGVSVSSDADHAEIAIIPMTEAVHQPMVYLEASLEKSTLLDVTYAGDTLTFSQDGEILAKAPADEHAELFKNRNRLKGWVHIGMEGQAVVQLVRFVDPHRHSGMSFLDGMNKIETLVEKTPFAGALTDHGVLHGTLDYYQQMKKRGKMPVIGFEAYSESINGEKERHHLLLIAKNEVGYKNLVKLSSLAQENIYYKPQVSYSMLMEHAEGVIATTGCLGSEVNKLLMDKDIHGARAVIETMIEIFGKENYFVEIQRHGSEEEITVNPLLEKLAREFDLRMVASTDAHYPNVEDRDDQELLLCIGTKKVYSDPDRMTFNGTGYHIHTDDEMETLFADLPSALDGTLELLELCKDFHIPTGVNHLPHFPVPTGFTDEMTYLRHLAEEGFQNRFAGTDKLTDPEYVERFTFELDTLEFMGFPGYFLIVQDFIRWAKARGIAVGPGRGSAAGSLVAYCLDITDLDPIPFGLLFERFLNPDRISMPDIDIDFPDDRREEVMEYVKEKYGEESFSKITTFQTLGVKSALKDVARVLEVDDTLINKLTKTVPNRPKITFEEVRAEAKDFNDMVSGSKILQRVVKTAEKIQGLPRNPSVHACARIITPGEVTDHVPVVMAMNAKTKERELASQYSMDEVEAVGLLKMDFLGLRTMTVIANATDLVNEERAKEGLPPMHYLDIPLGDPKVYQAISEGESYGVFQLESAGMRTFMKDLFADAHTFKENSIELFERLVAGVSLYRPGPMDYIPEYIENMNDSRKIRYDHPKLEPILKGTYGVIVYQEQTMLLVRELAGFSKGEADNVRKAFAKKKQEMIAPLKDKFLKGCEQNGVDLRVAEAIWLKMEKFGSYALT